MADGYGQPQIAEHFNTIGTQFPVKNVHIETVKILKNFINHQMERISAEEKVGMNLLEAYDHVKARKESAKTGVPLEGEDN